MRVYIAAPLFNEGEKSWNETVDRFVQDLGFTTYLPQRDGGQLAQMVKQASSEKEIEMMRDQVFRLDVQEVKKCDIFLFLMDGRCLDEGACFELGIAYTLRKSCLGFKTDIRSFADGEDNLMIRQALDSLSTNFSELEQELAAIKRKGDYY